MNAMSQTSVIYVAGSGRNGSTLLGLQLERCPDIFFAGELTHIWQRGFLNNELCGCGQPFRECSFWSEVTATAFGQSLARDLPQILQFRNRLSRFSNIPWMVAGSTNVFPRSQAVAYAQAYVQLVQAISEVSGCRLVVDSSKYPTDLAVLSGFSEIDLRVIHLVRNCHAVVHSWRRTKLRTEIHWTQQAMPRYGTVQTALGWKLFNRAITKVLTDRRLISRVVRYEDLVCEFERVMAELLMWLGCSSLDLSVPFKGKQHSVSGNPCRFQFDPQNIRIDDEWTAKQRWIDRLMVRLLCAGEQRRFGYAEA